jgi:hypothetical protein
VAEEHEADESHAGSDLGNDAWVSLEYANSDATDGAWRPLGIFRWETAAGVLGGFYGLHGARAGPLDLIAVFDH